MKYWIHTQKKITLLVVILFHLVIIKLPTYSQIDNPNFLKFSINDGLPHSYIGAIYQDKKGFLWIGTGAGLVKFNGYHFTTYKSELNNPNTLSNNIINSIVEDNEGVLWIGTTFGLNTLNPITGQIRRFLPDKNNKNSLNGYNCKVYCSLTGGIYVFFSDDYSIQKYDSITGGFSTLNVKNTAPVIFDSNQRKKTLYFVSENLKKLDTETDVISDLSEINEGTCYGLLSDNINDNIVWLANPYGLRKIDLKTNKREDFYYFKYDRRIPNAATINVLWQDAQGNIWCGTEMDGIHIFNPATKKFTATFTYNVVKPNSLSHNSVTSFYGDNAGNCWIGTAQGGINKLELSAKKFEHVDIFNANDNGLKDNSIWSVYETNEKVLYIGTAEKGINVYDRKTGRFSYFNSNKKGNNAIGAGIIGCISEDKNEHIWAISWQGTLNKIDKKTGKTKIYTGGADRTQNKLKGWSFRALVCDNQNRIWVGSLDEGLEIFDPVKEEAQTFVNEAGKKFTLVRSLAKGSNDNIWCSTSDGIHLINSKTKAVKTFTADPKNPEKIQCFVLSFYEENDSIVWLGSDCGLYRLNYTSGQLQLFNSKNGLTSDYIYSVYPDNKGYLWLSTGNGLSKFDKNLKTARNYFQSDGLQSNEFRWGAHFQTQKGEIILGGINGITIFHPDSIADNPFLSKTVLTGFKIFNNPIKAGDKVNGRVVLNKNIEYSEEIKLSWRESDFSFEFAGLHLVAPEKIQYAYMLEGYDETWKYTDATLRYANYTNIDPGKYLFRVKSTNNDGVWCTSNNEVALKIIITPPFWKTWWFRIFSTFAIIGLIYSWMRYRTYRLKLKQIVLEKKVKERTLEIEYQKEVLSSQADNLQIANVLLKEHSEELSANAEELKVQSEELFMTNQTLSQLNATKDRLFSIIAHDLKNPFQAIISTTELLQHRFEQLASDKKQLYLQNISHSAKDAYSLLSNLLDWARSQTNSIRFAPDQMLLQPIVEKVVQQLQAQASNKQIEVTNAVSPQIGAFADSNMVETIIRNLLSNAIKYTQRNGKVRITSDTVASEALLQVEDNGVGINRELIDTLFRVDTPAIGTGTEGEQGNGLGLVICNEFALRNNGKITVESTLGQGSCFTLWLPLIKTTPDSPSTPDAVAFTHRNTEKQTIKSTPLETLNEQACHILVVDDNVSIRTSLVAQLEDYYTVTEASNGREALEKIETDMPDLVVSDVMMPEMDGFELCETLKSDERTNHIPIILLTAKQSDQSRIKGLHLGADDYITKPFNPDVLTVRIQNLLQKREQMRAYFNKKLLAPSEADPKESENNVLNNAFIEKLVQIIEQHISDPEFAVDQLSEKVNMSRSTLYRKLMSIVDQNPSDFIKTVRLQYASRLLKQGNMNVTEVMFAVGFTYGSRFSENFKKMYGVSPSEYAKQGRS